MHRLTSEDWKLIDQQCTQAQRDAIELWNKGFGYKRIAFVLHIHPTTAKARIQDGLRKVGLSIQQFAA